MNSKARISVLIHHENYALDFLEKLEKVFGFAGIKAGA